MNDLQKVLVVDDGERSLERALSGDLAEMGFSSVTTSLEAAEDVLEMISPPSAIFLQMPSPSYAERHSHFVALGERLRQKTAMTAIPVILVDHRAQADGLSAIMSREFGPQVLDLADA